MLFAGSGRVVRRFLQKIEDVFSEASITELDNPQPGGEGKEEKNVGNMDSPSTSMRISILKVAAILCTMQIAAATFAYDGFHYSKLKESRNCPKCDLQVANLENLELNESDMSGAVCTAATFENSSLLGVDFEGAILIAGNFRKAYLEEGNFKLAKLQDADLSGTHLVNANFRHANLMGANLDGAIVIGADFEGAVWLDGHICRSGSIGSCNK